MAANDTDFTADDAELNGPEIDDLDDWGTDDEDDDFAGLSSDLDNPSTESWDENAAYINSFFRY